MDELLYKKIMELFPSVRYFSYIDARSAEAYHVPWRMLYDYEIIYVTEGQLGVIEIGNEYLLNPFDFHIMPPGIKHKRYIAGGNGCRYYDMHCDMFKTIGKNIDVQEVYIKPCVLKVEEVKVIEELSKNRLTEPLSFPRKVNIPDPKLMALLEKMDESYKNQNIFSQIELRGLLLQILSVFFSNLTKITTNQESLNNAIVKFISLSNEYDSINNLVNEVGYNKQYFGRIFKDKIKVSPKRYMILEKIEHAKTMIRTTEKNIKLIAGELGYDNPYYFSRLFKKYVGVSPKEYRSSANK